MDKLTSFSSFVFQAIFYFFILFFFDNLQIRQIDKWSNWQVFLLFFLKQFFFFLRFFLLELFFLQFTISTNWQMDNFCKLTISTNWQIDNCDKLTNGQIDKFFFFSFSSNFFLRFFFLNSFFWQCWQIDNLFFDNWQLLSIPTNWQINNFNKLTWFLLFFLDFFFEIKII